MTTTDARRLSAAHYEAGLSVRLWDGSQVAVGKDPTPGLCVSIRDAGVLGALLRRPRLETLVRQYAAGGIAYEGGTSSAWWKRSGRGARGVGSGS